jgi:hypothetical protein
MVGFSFLCIFVTHKITNMAKAKKQTIDADGNIVDVEVSTPESIEASIFVPEEPKKKPKQVQYYEFELVEKFQVNTVNQKFPFPENYMIKNTDLIYDPETKSERNIRYLEGVNTIWVDEQEHLSEQKQKQRPEIRFVNGRFRVPFQKTALVDFLFKTNMNKANPNRLAENRAIFTLIDNEAIDKKNFEKLENEMNATEVAKTAAYEIMLPHAQYLGVVVKDSNNDLLSERALRIKYYDVAKRMPDVFLKSYNNPIILAKFVIDRAIEAGLINLTQVKGQAIWSDTKAFIAQIPDGKKPAEFLAEFCLTEKGRDFYLEIKSLVQA